MKTNGFLSKIEEFQKVSHELANQNLIAFHHNPFDKQIIELKQLEQKLLEEKFYLVVIGLFKRGKSSLVNALVKKEVVPYSVVPLTSIVTLLEYGESNYAKIFFKDNHVEQCDIDSIYKYVTETENPLNIKNVEYVHIFIDSDFLRKVTLVDTPGIGSTYDNNTETTYGFVERIDAALFILSADLPISKTEVEFLIKLKSTVPKIIFVINKIDLIKKEELDKIISFNKSVLKNILGEDSILILPVSAKLAIDEANGNLFNSESGFDSLLNQIEMMLNNDKHDVILASAKNQFNTLLSKTETLLNIQMKALLTPLDKLNEDYSEFLKSLQIMRKDKGDFEILINGKIKQLQDYVTNQLYDFAKKLYSEFCHDIDQNTSDLMDNIKSGGIDAVYTKYFRKIEQSYEPLKLKLEKDVVERFHNILIEYSNGSNRFLNELVKNFSNASLFEFKDLVETFDLKIITVFYFLFDKGYNPFYLSNRFFRKFALQVLRKKIIKGIKESFKRNIDMSTGRINYDINYKIQESFRKFSFEFNNKMDDTLITLEKIITDTIRKKEQAEDSISPQVEYLSERLEKLSLIRNGK